jgi:hypothetical protein
MDRLGRVGRVLFGLAMGLFGLLCLVFASGRRWPVIGPPWTQGSAGAAWLVGIGLFTAAVLIVGGWPVQRLAAGALGAGILLRALIVGAPLLVKHPRNPNGWTVMFELVAMGGAALVLAGATGRTGVSERVEIKVGRYLFAISLLVFGVQHFMYANFIAGLVMAWIPWHFFWAEFVGVAFVGAAVSLATGIMARTVMMLLGAMFLLWVVVLHAPRVLGALHNGNEWTSGIVALAMGGAALILAGAVGD